MKAISLRVANALVAVAVLLFAFVQLSPASAAESYKIHAILSMSGNASFLGKGQQSELLLLQDTVNKTGGIKGANLEFVFHDDQTSPQLAVQLFNQIKASNPSVILGPDLVAMCNAVAPLTQAGPLTYCLSPGLRPKAGGFIYSTNVSTDDLVLALFTYFQTKGWTRVAIMVSNDATGQDLEMSVAAALKKPSNSAIQIVQKAYFNQTDVSVAAQIQRIKSSNPQVLVAHTAGAAVATIFKGLVQAGLDIPITTSNANMIYAQMAQFEGFLPRQLYFPSSLFVLHGAGSGIIPSVAEAQKRFDAVHRTAGIKPDLMATHVWDVTMLLVDALNTVGPNASAEKVKDYISGVTSFGGVNGLYDFKAVPNRGLDASSAIITRWDDQSHDWVVVSKPGGAALN
jgi:branched-chain amino acid transport system substrate-binding protein